MSSVKILPGSLAVGRRVGNRVGHRNLRSGNVLGPTHQSYSWFDPIFEHRRFQMMPCQSPMFHLGSVAGHLPPGWQQPTRCRCRCGPNRFVTSNHAAWVVWVKKLRAIRNVDKTKRRLLVMRAIFLELWFIVVIGFVKKKDMGMEVFIVFYMPPTQKQ